MSEDEDHAQLSSPRSPESENDSNSVKNYGETPHSPADDEEDEDRSNNSIGSPETTQSSAPDSLPAPKDRGEEEDDDDDDEEDAADGPQSPDSSPESPNPDLPASPSQEEEISSDSNASKPRSGGGDAADSDAAEAPKTEPKSPDEKAGKLNLSHEDLSDVSDLESIGEATGDSVAVKAEPENAEPEETTPPEVDPKKENDQQQPQQQQQPQLPTEKLLKTEDGEEQLDFEAEDGECVDEANKSKTSEELKVEEAERKPEVAKDLEEGELSDDDEVRPEETEPRPVCRFYSRGQCTWGASCRFLHPGVTDKGHYTMFDLIRPVVPGGLSRPYGHLDYRDERMLGASYQPMDRLEPPAESAWERGLRTAKEMMRKAIKRKEQDMDFEEKKMTLTLGQDDLDKENGYYTKSHSPPTAAPLPSRTFMHHPVADYHMARQEDYFGRRPPPHFDMEPRGMRIDPDYGLRDRAKGYREIPPHQMPDYYNSKYDEAAKQQGRPSRISKREVIVQPADNGRGRADDWADPWMRSKSPGGAREKRPPATAYPKKQYSSGSSYSSSSSSRSSSASSRSSYRSRSRSHSPVARSHGRQRQSAAGGGGSAANSSGSLAAAVSATATAPPCSSSSTSATAISHLPVSPSVIVSERKAANERALLMNPPAPSPRKARPPSPAMMRKSAQNPPAPTPALTKTLIDHYGRAKKESTDRKKLVAALAARVKGRSSRSSSGSDSSGSSSSDSESSYSSSSSSQDNSPVRKSDTRVELAMALKAKAMDALKSQASGGGASVAAAGVDKRQIKLNLKAATTGLRKPDVSESIMKKLAEGGGAKKRTASSPPSAGDGGKVANLTKALNSKKVSSRREELLKQLKAVEEAIAKKRSKIN